MAYPDDLIGKVIQLIVPKNPLTAPNPNLTLTGHGVDLSVPVFSYTPGRPGVNGAPSIPPKFTDTNVPWNINFLEYIPGEVTTVKLMRPVLTGPMSGCYLFRYTVGGSRIAHVGTHDLGPDAPLSIRAKSNWKAYLAQSGATSVVGASPADFYDTSELGPAQVGRMGGVPQVYGLFEPSGNSYAVMLAPMGSDITSRLKMMLFVAMKRMYLQPWPAISALRTFR